MRFIDRADEMRRLDAVLVQPGAFAAIWGRRRVGKTRLLIEWSQRHDGLYAAADPSALAVQRRYLAGAVERRFPGFADVEYPDWRSFLLRLTREADRSGWSGPFVLDELPYLIAADATLTGVLQAWVDTVPGRPTLVVSGSSQRMMHGAILSAGAPLYGRAREAFAVRPLRPGYLAEPFPEAEGATCLRSTRCGAECRATGSSPKRSASISRTRSTRWCSTPPARCTWSRIGCSWRKFRPPRLCVRYWT